MIGEKYYTNNQFHRCPFPDAQAFDIHSALRPKVAGNSNDGFSFIQNDAALQALMRYLPSNSSDAVGTGSFEYEIDKDVDLPADAYSSDNFHMYDFKVRSCSRGGSHDWTDCPYAHPGEKARRRDPRKYYYSGTACPEFRKGSCRMGDACEFAHGVFECWLHPARYRTQPCKDGLNCNRRVCFFAHAPEQLRVLSPRAVYPYDGAYEVSCDLGSTPSDSPPMSPINGMVASLRQLQLSKINSLPSPCSATMGSPRLGSAITQRIRPGFWSLPATPTRTGGRPGLYFDRLEEAPMERVESGRDVRAKMFEKIGKENPLTGEHPNSNPYPTRSDDPNPDVGWVSELVQ